MFTKPAKPRKKGDAHIHTYTDFKFIREVGIDRLILTRNCACGDSQAFECGSKDRMQKLYTRLIEKYKKET